MISDIQPTTPPQPVRPQEAERPAPETSDQAVTRPAEQTQTEETPANESSPPSQEQESPPPPADPARGASVDLLA